MRKDLTLPRTVEEMETRIKKATFQLRSSPRTIDDQFLRQRLGYIYDEQEYQPQEIRDVVRQDLERRRQKLSDRVRQRFKRSGDVSLVCDLLRESPIFLKDQWVVDLFINRRVTAQTHPDREDRQRALRDLRQLSQALLEVRLPSGEWRRKRRNRPISASHRQLGLTEAVLAIGAYGHYLEIATCLTRFWDLVDPAWEKAKAAGTSRAAFIESYAAKLQIPAKWVNEWGPTTSAFEWAREKTAWRLKTTASGVAKLQRQAHRRVREFNAVDEIARAATERLRPLRMQKSVERAQRGEGSVHRRY